MSTWARNGMVLSLSAAVAWCYFPDLHLSRAAQVLEHTRQFWQQAQRNPDQALLSVLLQFEPLSEIFRRTT